MSDNRYYGDRNSGRSDSIFNDDDRGSSGGGGRGEDRGFLQRASDQVMNWFGGDEDDRGRRDMPRERGDYGAYQQGREGQSGPSGSFGSQSPAGRDYGREFTRQPSYHGQPQGGGASQGTGSQPRGGGSHHLDDHYRSWRERQIQQLDSDYEDYCRHRQEQFEQEFRGWRERQSGGRPPNGDTAGGASAGMTGQAGIASGRTGSGGLSEGSGAATVGSQVGASGSGEAMASGGATASGGSALGDKASTGSSGGGTRGRAKPRP